MHRFTSCIVGVAVAIIAFSPAAWTQPDQVEEIYVQGLSRMTRQAFLHAFGVRVGDPYDPTLIRQRFRELWDLRLFEDIVIEAEEAPQGGMAVIVKVRERPVLTAITYEENRVVTRTQIEDRLRERDINLGLGKPLDMGAVFFAESAIRDLLAEKGYLDGTVTGEVRDVAQLTRSLHFEIGPGGKTRIRSIRFVGNEIMSNRKLKTSLDLTQERKWYWPWSQKNLYHPIKWDQDIANLRDLYQDKGYLDIELKAPIVEVRESKKTAATADPVVAPVPVEEPADLSKKQIKRKEKADEKARKKERKAEQERGKRWVELTVPVSEGPQYRLGEITIIGSEVFPEEALRAIIPLREGAVLSNGLLEFGTERITRLYEDRGHLYATAVRNIDRRDDEDVADVVVSIDEDAAYSVGRIDFQGNSRTQDRVLRREVALAEGQLFSRSLLDVSKRKINQLGYWQVAGEPVIEPDEEKKAVRITFSGEEQGRNEIQVGGGYSGLDGAFFNGVYSTRNFLGRGQVVSTALQIGGRSNRYQISFREPWFLNRPYLFGVNLFRRDTDFGASLRSTSSGGGILLGRRVGRYSQIQVGYNYEEVTSTSFGTAVSGEFISLETQNQISSLTPVFSYSTIDNPYRPSRGRSLTISTQIAGGPLGGSTSYLKPLIEGTMYKRAFGRSYFALHGELGVVREFGNETNLSSDIEGIPRFQRFWLGGDTLGPRVFETRTITPRRFVKIDGNTIVDVLGNPTGQQGDDFLSDAGGVPVLFEVGGDRMYLFQSELVFPLNEQADLAFFVDAGDVLFEDTSLGFETMRVSAGVEMRFNLPIFPVPLRLIYGVPIRELSGDRTSSFTFSIGRSF